jgi:dUTP pyrophosphatase
MALLTTVDQLQVRLLRPGAEPPARTRPGDAGYDLRTAESFSLWPGERATVPTGIAVALPPGVAGLVTPRSGLASAHGISVVNGPGLIDPNYRGEIRVVLVNLGDSRFGPRSATASRSCCWCRWHRRGCGSSMNSRPANAVPGASAPPVSDSMGTDLWRDPERSRRHAVSAAGAEHGTKNREAATGPA